MKKQLVVFIIFFGCYSMAMGATINVPADYPSLQKAVDEASDYDEIVVADGA